MINLGGLLVLSLLQGITEFLPVSSSGHLVFLAHLLQLKETPLAWIVAFHLGTLISIIIYFQKELKKILFSVFFPKKIDKEEKKEYLKLCYLLLWGSLPAAIVGFTFYQFFNNLFQTTQPVAIALFINGWWLLGCEKYSHQRQMNLKVNDLSWKQALFIGGGQALALIPGISRSGATLGCGYLCGLKKEVAFNFAFLLALPSTLGAFLLSLGKHNYSFVLLSFIIVFTALFGYLTLKLLFCFIRKKSLIYFAFYCWIIAFLAYFFLS